MTRNIVPRKNGEASIGTSDKNWGAGYFEKTYIKGECYINNVAVGDKLKGIDNNKANIEANKSNLTLLSSRVDALQASVGTPLVASTAAAMTDKNKIYVYTGTESGYTNGNWYYHNGTTWVSGGIYNSTGFSTDKTLSVDNAAADASIVGKDLNALFSVCGVEGDHFETGGNMRTNNRIISKKVFVRKGTCIHLSSKGKYNFVVRKYDSEISSYPSSLIPSDDWQSEDVVIPEDSWIAINFCTVPSATFSSLDDIKNKIFIIQPVESVKNTKKLNEQVQHIFDILKTPLIPSRFASGGNMTPNNRIVMKPIYLSKGSIIDTIDSSYSYCYSIYKDKQLNTRIYSSSSEADQKYDGWLNGVHFIPYAGYVVISVAHSSTTSWTNNNAAFETLNDADNKIYIFKSVEKEEKEEKEEEIYVEDAKHVQSGTSPLTLLHFSDIHGDKEALQRILTKSKNMAYDDAICTGDMAANTNDASFSDWWDKSILTCIGNHDCATQNSDYSYNWDALSMAERYNLYIKPFEENWSIHHPENTSYYYKDYTSKNVRLIVLDSHLDNYVSTATEAEAQTKWLKTLLSDAIVNNLHVLIATHYAYPGSKAIQCSFSQYNTTTYNAGTGAKLAESTVSAVKQAIEKGLHFIGYISGHIHQDNIFDALGDGKQLQFNITCAAVSYKPQWVNADLYRDEDRDAFNILVIDTTHTLIKLIRGGGANMDNCMRPRKAICIDYSKGQVVGEIK